MGKEIEGITSLMWRIRDEGREFELKYEEMIKRILSGDISYSANIYDEENKKWIPITEKPEFLIAFPILPFMKFGDELKYLMNVYEKSIVGVVSVGPEWKELISVANAFREKGLPRGIAFFMPLLSKDVKKRITKIVKIFHLFDNFLVGGFFEDDKVPASTETPLFIVAVNVSSSYASHSIIPYEFPVPETEKHKLHFDLPPKKWVLRCLRLDTSGSNYGAHKIEFRTASTAERAAKTGIALALTLGMLRYVPGYKAFSISFEITPPNSQKTMIEYLQKGELLCYVYDFLAARDELEIAIEKEPNYPKAHRELGTVYALLNEDERAEYEFKKAIELDQNDDAAHNNLGALYNKLNRTEEAEREFREAVRIKPDNLVNRYNLAVFLRKRGKHDEAKKECLEMLKLDPKYVPAYVEFFSLLMGRKGLTPEELRQIYLEAEQVFLEGITQVPNDANMHSYLGYIECCLRKFKEAEREFNVALRLDPKNQLAHAFLALKRKGEWEK